MENRSLAPVVIPTLCRYEHFLECIESLSKNDWAGNTEVYIALDYPAKEEHMGGYKKICEYLKKRKSILTFKEVHIIKREKNLGPFLNEELAINEVLKKFPYFIRTDDDTVFSPCFLEFVNKALWKYEKDETVIAVTGYAYPINYKKNPESTCMRHSSFCSMWGTAFWKDRYESLKKSIAEDYCLHYEFDKLLKNKAYRSLSDARFINFVDAGLSWNIDKLVFMFTDIGIGTYMALHKVYIISPIFSLVKNNGFDGSGYTCPRIENNCFDDQIIKEELNIELIENDKKYMKINEDIINNFDSRPSKLIYKMWVKIVIYKIIGKNIYRAVWKKRNGGKYKEFIMD